MTISNSIAINNFIINGPIKWFFLFAKVQLRSDNRLSWTISAGEPNEIIAINKLM